VNTYRPQRWVLALTSVASLMVSLDTQVVATALPVIRLRLHASLAALEWKARLPKPRQKTNDSVTTMVAKQIAISRRTNDIPTRDVSFAMVFAPLLTVGEIFTSVRQVLCRMWFACQATSANEHFYSCHIRVALHRGVYGV